MAVRLSRPALETPPEPPENFRDDAKVLLALEDRFT